MLQSVFVGLFRRSTQKNETHPVIGILPVGRENTFGQKLFNFTKTSELQLVQGLADASLSVVRGNVVPVDVMKIEVIDKDAQEKVKPVYALSSFEWSPFIDAFNERDRYWYLGSLRDYATFVFNAFNNSIEWNRAATLTYSEPCTGCSNCYVAQKTFEAKSSNRRWWSAFIPSFRLGSSQSGQKSVDYSKVQNANCNVKTSIECDSVGFIVSSSNVEKSEESRPHLALKIIKGQDGFDFISDSWNRLNKGQINLNQEHAIRTVEIFPKSNTKSISIADAKGSDTQDSDAQGSEAQDSRTSQPENERFFYIDHESYEVKPIRITLLPKLINFFST